MTGSGPFGSGGNSAPKRLLTAGNLEAVGGLRAGLSVDEAADVIWATNSSELYVLLTVERGWLATAARWAHPGAISALEGEGGDHVVGVGHAGATGGHARHQGDLVHRPAARHRLAHDVVEGGLAPVAGQGDVARERPGRRGLADTWCRLLLPDTRPSS